MRKTSPKTLFIVLLLCCNHGFLFAQKDTIQIDSKSLLSKSMNTGKSNYIIFTKKANNSIAMDLTYIEIDVIKNSYKNVSAYTIQQNWYQKDTLIHTATSVLEQNNLKTLHHKSWWKRNQQTTEIDYISNQFSVLGGDLPSKQRAEEGMKKSLTDNEFINWHCDLHLFSLLPFKKSTVFKIKVYDPGFSAPKYETYEVIGEEQIDDHDCWILNYVLPNNMGYQRFWISKSERIIIKEEDNFKGNYRYKLKTNVTN